MIIKSKPLEERYNNLNTKQREAVDTINGPVLVVAGPGSGKTELLSIRTAKILQETDILPSNILLLTFTEAACFNMRERLIKLIGEDAYRVGIYTFHSFASDIINKYPECFFEGARFSSASEVDQINIIENILKNLPRKNPLSTVHPELGYIYLRDIISAIRDLKKGGYSPEKFEKQLEKNNKDFKDLKHIVDDLEDIAGKRKYDEIIGSYVKIYQKIEKLSEKNEIAKVLERTLSLAIKTSQDENSSKPLTTWKNRYTTKTDGGKFLLKDLQPERIEKLESLLGVYSMYQSELYKQGLYDFEDMIMLVVKQLQEKPNLKNDLQERFQYLMIDEFQDTNESQFQLALELSNNQFLENPNILAVGDDDQAIFKFQGAELNNIFSFKKNFPDTKVIVLDKNYRSTQDILDFARTVIVKAEDRLEVRDKNINKKIQAENGKFLNKKIGEIKIEKFDSSVLEYEYISKEIKKLLQNGIDPKEIAVIGRKHNTLKEISAVLNAFQIPYSYTKQENILDKPHIHELVTILKFLCLQQNGKGEELLPEILSYNFWGIDRVEIWKIAEQVRNYTEDRHGNIVKKNWLQAMNDSDNMLIKQIGNFLINLTVKSHSTPLEYLLDEIIGTTEFLWEDSEYDDTFTRRVSPAKDFISPYKKYYFNGDKFRHNRTEYLNFLSALRTFIGALREFHSRETLYCKDILEFIETYSGNRLTLSFISPFSSSENAVSLLTAHAAKGLEYEYVFLLSAEDEHWGKSGKNGRIVFPINMPLTPEGENDDDKIRLLYVALTRAKHTLYITHSKEKLSFLSSTEEKETKKEKKEYIATENMDQAMHFSGVKEFVKDEKFLLKRLLEKYKMPVTHLNNFLNFTRVGPQNFIEQSILRFPQATTPSSAYGSAMHGAIERYFLYYAHNNKVQPIDTVKNNFASLLERARLPDSDYKKYLESGLENLEIYIKYLENRKILPNTKVETRFKSEDVIIGSCPITGNIDRMEFIDDKEIIVTDLKTGESYDSFEEAGLQDYEKIKLHFYKYQLAFYALLIENSKSFHNYHVKTGTLEFLEANQKGKIVVLPFEINNEIKERVVRLANIVCNKIHNLDFPDTSNYPQNYKGILQFEDDLLNGNL